MSRFIATRPGLILAIALAVTALAVFPASRLSIRTELEAMLPDGTPASQAYREFLRAFGGIERVYVIVSLQGGAPPDPDRLADAAETLAGALAASPEVKHIRYGLDETDEAFAAGQLAPRLPLLLDEAGIADLRGRLSDAAIDARVAELKDAASGPAAVFLSSIAAADPLGLARNGLRAMTPTRALPFDPITGALLSRDQRAALLVVTPTRSEADAAGGRALVQALDAAYAATRRAEGDELAFEAVGGPLYAMHDQAALKDDLIRIVTAAGIVVLLMIVVAFRGLTIPAASIAAVAVGQMWCAAMIALTLGHVTAIGVGFAAILLGLGDDFTIHLGSRFREIWGSGVDRVEAMRRAFADAWLGLLTAAATTAAAFAVLGLAHFRPLRELGVVVALGMVLLLLATFVIAAPLLLIASRFWKARGDDAGGLARIVTAGVRAGTEAPRATLLTCGVLLAIAALGIFRLRIDTDLRRLRPSDHPAAAAERALVRDFAVGLDTSTVLVPGRDVADALDHADAVARLTRSRFPSADVSTPSDWIVDGQRLREKMTALAPLHLGDVARRLALALDRQGLNVSAFAPALDAMRAIGEGRPPDPIPLSAWPDWLADGVKGGASGATVAVHVRMPEGAWPAGPPEPFLASLQEAAPGSRIAHAARLGVELKSVALADLARLGALAAAVVLVIVAISYRGDLTATALTFVPVVLGTAWTAGLWGWIGRPLDLFSLCVLPVMMGIGVDDGLHVLHLARRRGEDLRLASLQAGRGVVLTNLTTCAGFASLGLSHVPALRNGGLLICVGNLLCLAATLVVLPAVAQAPHGLDSPDGAP